MRRGEGKREGVPEGLPAPKGRLQLSQDPPGVSPAAFFPPPQAGIPALGPWSCCTSCSLTKGTSGSSAHRATYRPWGRASPEYGLVVTLGSSVTSPIHSQTSNSRGLAWPGIGASGPTLLLPTVRLVLPFGGVSSMSFFWQKVAGKMAWEEA